MELDFEMLERLRSLGVARATFAGSGSLHEVEFFPPAEKTQFASPELFEKAKPAEPERNPSTGLTREQTQNLLNMPE